MNKFTYTSVLSIAGFDGSGGAGIQSDIKTVSALGCYSTTVLTALPVQNTQGVRNIHSISTAAVAEQLDAILEDIPPQAIKIGMVHTARLVETIVDKLSSYPDIPVVFDPVMVSTSGHHLIEQDTIQAIKALLLPIADMITPNMDEAAILAEMDVNDLNDMTIAGERIFPMTPGGILLKGGHQKGRTLTSLYMDVDKDVYAFEMNKIDTKNTHGSGCTLSSAIASFIARGESKLDAVTLAQNFIEQAIFHGRDVVIGKGHGPLNHFFNPTKLIKNELVG